MINRLFGHVECINRGASVFDADELQRACRDETDPAAREMLFRQHVDVLNAELSGSRRDGVVS